MILSLRSGCVQRCSAFARVRWMRLPSGCLGVEGFERIDGAPDLNVPKTCIFEPRTMQS